MMKQSAERKEEPRRIATEQYDETRERATWSYRTAMASFSFVHSLLVYTNAWP